MVYVRRVRLPRLELVGLVGDVGGANHAKDTTAARPENR